MSQGDFLPVTLPHHTTLNFLISRISSWRQRAQTALDSTGPFRDLCMEAEGFPIVMPESVEVFRRY